jgi:hypothetical protein
MRPASRRRAGRDMGRPGKGGRPRESRERSSLTHFCFTAHSLWNISVEAHVAAQILPFPTPTVGLASPIACFIRVGDAHRKFADLHAAGRLPPSRAVIEASRFRHQRELVTALRESGAEIVLDSEAAELAAPAKFLGHSRRAPWAVSDGNGPQRPEHFRRSSREDVVGQIARFAVENRTSVVLAPSHFLGDPACQDWLSIDAASCIALREALGREGGKAIAID